MQQKATFILLLVLSVAIGFVRCQSEDEEGGLWSRLKKMVKEFVNSMKGIWNQMKEEIESRTVDMRSWTQEMFDSFKVKMKEWVDQVGGASKSEREEMTNYIERLQMPKEEQTE